MKKFTEKAICIGSGLIPGVALTLGFQKFYEVTPVLKTGKERTEQPTLQTSIYIKGDPILGDKNAPITLAVFSDYECPYCKKFHDDILPHLKRDYINKKVLRLVHKDLPLPFHPNAELAARVARCSADDQEYWQVYSALFSKQQCLSCLGPIQIAKEYGLRNQGSLKGCLKSNNISQAIASNTSEASLNNIKGTPTFIIGPSHGDQHSGQLIEGVMQWPEFKKRIDKLLLETKS